MAVLEGQQLDVRERGREHFARREWGEAYAHLASAQASLDPDERILLAMSAYLLGCRDACIEHLEHAYRESTDEDQPAWAARCAFWLAFVLLERGEVAHASGWVARGQGLLDDHGLDVVEHGYLLAPSAVQLLYAGDGDRAGERFARIMEIASRFEDIDLLTLGRLGSGQTLILRGEIETALPLLDEAMVTVTADQVNPVVTGLVYCAVIEICQNTFDLHRAQEWTAALDAWCGTQPDLVPYRGQCQVHRVEIMCIRGAWRDAMAEVMQARQRLSEPPGQPAVGAAIYQEAELHRLQGRSQRAEEAYAQASAQGHDPQPGLALLRLAQGSVGSAVAGLRRAMDEAAGRSSRPRLLAAYVEAALAAGDPSGAATAAHELVDIAERHDAPLLRAFAAQAMAAVHLADGSATSALREARRAWSIWHEFGAPYEAARSRLIVGLACEALGDHDAAELEVTAARRAFERLGARSDLAQLPRLPRGSRRGAVGGLTAREVEVLQLVADGHTNRAVAEELHLSDKTVARHLSNIYTKLGVSSRSAATAWAYEHDLR